ncbi:hypothetical protein MSMTP_0424 [Methanosarcina sp. MTP4]|nr:hypothetical protein MSMTP_0424 [Methanosarcina sp. MTP4]
MGHKAGHIRPQGKNYPRACETILILKNGFKPCKTVSDPHIKGKSKKKSRRIKSYPIKPERNPKEVTKRREKIKKIKTD